MTKLAIPMIQSINLHIVPNDAITQQELAKLAVVARDRGFESADDLMADVIRKLTSEVSDTPEPQEAA